MKESKDLLAVKQYIRSNFGEIKEILFGGIVLSDDLPQLKLKGLKRLCQMAKIEDKIVEQAVFETMNERLDERSNEKRIVARYEFIEVLTRIAGLKYIVSGLMP